MSHTCANLQKPGVNDKSDCGSTDKWTRPRESKAHAHRPASTREKAHAHLCVVALLGGWLLLSLSGGRRESGVPPTFVSVRPIATDLNTWVAYVSIHRTCDELSYHISIFSLTVFELTVTASRPGSRRAAAARTLERAPGNTPKHREGRHAYIARGGADWSPHYAMLHGPACLPSLRLH